jgi:phosphate transport system substrate-binding protein
MVLLGSFGVWALLAMAAAAGAGEPPAPPGILATDPLAESRRLQEEIRVLDTTGVGKEMSDINASLSAAYQQQEQMRQPIQQRMSELRQTAAYKQYEKKRQEIARQLDAARQAERKAMADTARRIYEARHEELGKLAVEDCPEARRLNFDVLTYPKVDGSTSTQPLSVILASRVLGVPFEWIYPEPEGGPWVPPSTGFFLMGQPLVRSSGAPNYEFTLAASRVVAKPAARTGGERIAIMINSLLAISSATHDAYVNLIAGQCDLNLTARRPSADELALADRRGVKIELRPIAKDALVFIVNRQNPVTAISRQQIQQIYQRRITNWADLGGAATNIVAYWRERNSGSRELFDALVTPGQSLPEPALTERLFADSMGGPYNQVTQKANGVGYSVYYYERFMALSPYTRTVAIDGVEPTSDTIASGKYPYTADVYAAYCASEPPSSPAMKLLAWLLSPEGQMVVRESGYVLAR